MAKVLFCCQLSDPAAITRLMFYRPYSASRASSNQRGMVDLQSCMSSTSILDIPSTRFTLSDLGGNASRTWVKVNLLVDPNFDPSKPSPQGWLELIRGQVDNPGSPMRAAASTPCQQAVPGTAQENAVFVALKPPCEVDILWYIGLILFASFIPLVPLYTWLTGTTAADHGTRDPLFAVGVYLVLEVVDIISDVQELQGFFCICN